MLKKHSHATHIIGIDEAGRGALAGPVVAATVYIAKYESFTRELKDSKKLSASKREYLYTCITQSKHIHHAIGMSSVEEIDRINILEATYLAMHRAIDKLDITPDMLYVDGNRFKPYMSIPHKCIIGGDDIYRSIAAASILAKVCRDTLMKDLHLSYPIYHLDLNKGYGTKDHRDAIEKHGKSPIHRVSFKLKK